MLQPVGFWARLAATILDSLLFLITGLILSMLFSESVSTNLNDMLSWVYMLLLPIFWYGYTIGKRALGIRIVKKDGKNVGFWNMFRRNILAPLVYFAPLILGFALSYALLGWENGELFLDDDIVLIDTEEGEAMYNEATDEYFYADGLSTAYNAIAVGFLGSMGLILASALMVGIRKDKRSVHDFVAGTYVTRALPGQFYSDEEKTMDSTPDVLGSVPPTNTTP